MTVLLAEWICSQLDLGVVLSPIQHTVAPPGPAAALTPAPHASPTTSLLRPQL